MDPSYKDPLPPRSLEWTCFSIPLTFLAEANATREEHLVTFQGNVERKMVEIERELRQAREEI